jgi:condensation domain-containing protein/phosphopantetheine binding protein
MVPAAFVFLQRIPLTAHGKVDRSALLAMPEGLRAAGSEFVPPRNAREQVLTSIWAHLLKVKDIGVFSNFFDMGGHSLLAGRVLARVATEFGVSLPIRTLFEAPTIEALARRIDSVRKLDTSKPRPEFVRVGKGPPLVSIMQEEVLWLERQLPGLPQFNLTFAYRLQGPLNVAALERSLTELMRRHDSLRTGFGWAGEQAIATITPACEAVSSLVIEDLAVDAPRDVRAKALLLKKAHLRVEQEAWTPFDIGRVPLLRSRLLRLGPHHHILLLVLHHVIADGWSIGIFLEEVSQLYASFAVGRAARLPPPALQFPDVAHWQRWWCTTDSATRQVTYWKERLRAASPVFPMAVNSGKVLGSPITHEPLHLSKRLAARLSALARSQGGTLFMTLLAGFKTMLLSRSGRDDICVATLMANRSQPSQERVIGPLENTTLIRTHMHCDLSFLEALARVRDAVLEAHAHQELPFDILASRLAEDGLDPASLIQVFFVLQNAFQQPFKLRDLAVTPFASFNQEVQPALPVDRTWLTVMLKEEATGITGSWSCKNALFEANTLPLWIADFKALLAKAAANPELPLGHLAWG